MITAAEETTGEDRGVEEVLPVDLGVDCLG
jgi:hypothetical protein